MKTKAVTINFSNEFTFTIYILLTVLSTFLLAHNQIIVGSVVNAMLFFSAKNISKRYHFAIAVFPSLIAVTQGLLFGSLTVFLLYFLPFIWLGNYVLIFVSNKFSNKILGVVLSSLAKSSILFFVAVFFFKMQLVPKMFLTAMGSMQLLTALIGGLFSSFLKNK